MSGAAGIRPVSIQERFPLLAAGLSPEFASRVLDYHDGAVVALLFGAARGVGSAARQVSLDAFEQTTLALIDEALAARGQAADDAERTVIDALVLQVATGVAATTAATGEV